MKIYGAGMAGLLAANMLKRHSPIVHEKQKSLPNNHEALLRFRTNAVSIATNIPFEEVLVHKGVYYDGKVHSAATLDMMNEYSHKVTGVIMPRSITNLKSEKRFIAPANFIEQLATGVEIEFESEFRAIDPEPHEVIISTIPMTKMIGILGMDADDMLFDWQPIWVKTWMLPKCNVHQTIYFPDEAEPYYRASISGERLMVEYVTDPSNMLMYDDLERVGTAFGFKLNPIGPMICTKQTFGKLLPLDDKVRKKIMRDLTEHYNIYSLGRFGTWRQILLDDVVKDIMVIDKLIDDDSPYNRALHEARK